MRQSEFAIATEFWCGDKHWRCTDVGMRVIVAVCLDDHREAEGWYIGPPYAVAEIVFDESDIVACELVSKVL